jgi:transcriptional regulator with XRE-family HTH domain
MSVSTHCPQSFWSSREWVTTMHAEMANHRQAVGRRFKALRQNRRLSQEDAAHLAGVSLTTWRNWERGLRAPYERNWDKLAEGFELSDEEIAAVRGTPPAPLGTGESQTGEILSLLRGNAARLAKIEELLEALVLGQLEDEGERPTKDEPGDTRAANGP